MILSIFKILFAIFFSAFVATLELLMIPFHKKGNLFHKLAKFHARGVLAVSGVKVVTKGVENLDLSRSYIYVANHASLFDIPSVIAGVPDQIRIVYKKELEKIPIFGWGLKYGKTYIGIDRGKGQRALQSLEKAANKIRTGASVLMFAEGTRTTDGNLQPFKRGAFNLAVKARVPVVPLTIIGSYHVLPKNSLKINPGTIELILDKPIEPMNDNGKAAEMQLMDSVHRAITKNFEGVEK
jgi:1-acyl-sn-glycerol-3-phosphate acyltransferase